MCVTVPQVPATITDPAAVLCPSRETMLERLERRKQVKENMLSVPEEVSFPDMTLATMFSIIVLTPKFHCLPEYDPLEFIRNPKRQGDVKDTLGFTARQVDAYDFSTMHTAFKSVPPFQCVQRARTAD